MQFHALSVCLFPFHARVIFSGTSIWKSSSNGSFPETILVILISSYPFKCISSKVPATAAQAVLPASRVCCKSSGINEGEVTSLEGKKSQHPAALNPKLPEILPKKVGGLQECKQKCWNYTIYTYVYIAKCDTFDAGNYGNLVCDLTRHYFLGNSALPPNHLLPTLKPLWDD